MSATNLQNFSGDVQIRGTTFIKANTNSDNLAIGTDAGATVQGDHGVAVGREAGKTSQGAQGVAVGYQAGKTEQGVQAIAMGYQAGQTSQGDNAVAVGRQAGISEQGANATAVGRQAGTSAQGTAAVAVGFQAGNSEQGSQSVAVGTSSGHTSQANSAVAVGWQAGKSEQGGSTVAVGLQAGETSQGGQTVAVGVRAGRTEQGAFAVAVGSSSGHTSQGDTAVAVGWQAGKSEQGGSTVAVGNQAGETSQGAIAVAVGVRAGNSEQGASAVAVGTSSGMTSQGVNSVAVGYQAGKTEQGTHATAVGFRAGESEQGGFSTAMGYLAGKTSQGASATALGLRAGESEQGTQTVAVGTSSGMTSQGAQATAMGYVAGNLVQGANAVAIGVAAGRTSQGASSTAVGHDSGMTSQGIYSVAVGRLAGQIVQGCNCVAIGVTAGQTSQGGSAIAVGLGAGQVAQGGRATAIGEIAGSANQGANAVAIGLGAGRTAQGQSATAVGHDAGNTSQGASAVAIGHDAGVTGQGANSIILNASGAAFNQTTASTFNVKPVRGGNIAASALAYTSGFEIVEETNMHFDGSGNVGIGTTAPNFPLSFSNLDGNKIQFNDGSSAGHNITTSSGWEWNFNAARSGEDDDAKIIFKISGSSGYDEMMRVDHTGVGIGTNNPVYLLDVADQHGDIDAPMVNFRVNRDGASNGDGNVLRVENAAARTDAELYDATSNGTRQFSVKASGRCEAREFEVCSLVAGSFLGGDGGSSDGIFSRPDGQAYISIDDTFYFRDNVNTTANRRGVMETNTGNFKVTGSFTSSASLDYSEYFEWYDGNPDNEDRIGYSVSLFPGTDMIKKCEEGETPIGIVSGTSGFTGGGADIYWKGYWEQDAWGRPVDAQQLIHGEPVFNEDGTPKMKRVVNPDWDSTSMDTYIPRKDRKEWACVGLLGQVLMRPECVHSPFWTKMKSVDSEKDLWLISLFPSINKDLENDLEVEKAKTTSLETQLASVLARLDALESA